MIYARFLKIIDNHYLLWYGYPMSTTPKTDKLKIRERKFVRGLAAGLTPTAAMRKAGYTQTTAMSKAAKKVGESHIQESIRELMAIRGLTAEKLLCKLDEGLDSTKVISANVVSPGGEGMSDAHGATKDFIDVPDYATRHKYLDTALKLGSHYPAEKKEVTGPDGGPLQIMSIEVIIVD